MYRRTPSFIATSVGPGRSLVAASVAIGYLLLVTPSATAALLTRTSNTPAASGASSSSAAQTSQTATAATLLTAQSAATSTRAAASLQRLNTAMQALQSQMAAQNAANLRALNNLNIDQKTGTSPASLVNVANGIGNGALLPSGGAIVNPAGSSIQSIQLQSSGSGISLANGGNVSLVKGTGNGLLTASGAGTVVATGGTITATTGGLSTATTSGGTLTTTNGGTVTTTAANETVASSSATIVTISGSGGTITALDGTTTTFTAPITSVSFALPAGSTVKLSAAGTVTATGATVLSLSGAGSLATTSGGAVSNTGGTTTFSGSVSATLPGGAAIDFSGSSSLSLASGSSGFSINVPTSAAATPIGSASVANTTGYVLPSSWVNVGSLTDSQPVNPASGGLTDVVNVVQTGQQALLTWDSFNIGARTELDFDQSAGGANVGNWVAINKITSNINPSWILGSIQAPGQVYVINPNGIIFTGTSQVNTHTLIASSLPINNNLVNTGLLNNSADLSYLFSSLESSTTGAALFTPPLSTSSSPANPAEIGGTAPDGGTVVNVATGGVVVEAGAQIVSPTTPEHVGGRVALIGPSVENDGTISTPDGQTILAAGFQVGFLAHNANDPTLRGLDVYLGAATDATGAYNGGSLIQAGLFPTAGIAANGLAINDPNAASLGVPALTADYGQSGSSLVGLIDTPRADLYMAGANIQQNSIVNSSTSVALNGRIDMVSTFDEISFLTLDPSTNATITSGLPSSTGSASFGAGSITQILPEETTDTVVGTQLALNSSINVQGLMIDLQPGALLLAPDASVDLLTGNYGRDSQGIKPIFISDQGTITAEQGSAIDVSGSAGVNASVAENIVAVQLRGTELANSPVQQNGALRGQTVYVDMSQYGTYDGTNWIGSPIGDLSGYAALIQHTASELSVNGGTISLTAGTSVSVNSGATLDVSGGSINYAGASVATTKVVSDGQIFDISQATPDRIYSGILTNFSVDSSKWGVSQSYANSKLAPQYDPGYIQGGNGGTVTITAPSIALNGTLSGNTTPGARQNLPQSSLPTTFGSGSVSSLIQSIYGLPKASTLQLDFSNNELISGSPLRIPNSNLNVNFQSGTVTNSTPSAAEFDLSTDLMGLDGFGNLKLADDFGTISLPANTPLSIAPGGTLTLSALAINISSDISAPGGTLNFAATSSVTLNANLNLRGLVVDTASSTSSSASLPEFINGGTAIIQSSNIFTNPGSSIDVSGGLYASPANKLTYGSAGAITLAAAEDLLNAQGSLSPEINQLTLNATLKGFSGLKSGAGKLSLQAPLIQIGGSSLLNGGTTHESLLLPASFFSQGGFGTFSLTGIGDSTNAQRPSVLVAPGTIINQPQVQSWVAENVGDQYLLTPTTLPLQSLRSPIAISLNAPGVSNPVTGILQVEGNVVIGQGASISLDADPANSVQLSGGNFGTVAVLGQILVPGGTIAIETDGTSSTIFAGGGGTTTPLTTIDLGSHSILSTSGATELSANVFGLKTGTVLNGGTITVSGNILAEQGSQILVDGASDTLSVASGFTPTTGNLEKTAGSAYVQVPVYSNGGSISLKGREELFTEATLSGAAGGASAQGGSLTISSGSFFSPTDIGNLGSTKPIYPNDASLVLTNNALTFDSGSITESAIAGAIGIQVLTTGPLVTDAHGKTIYGYFSTHEFAGSGLGSLNLLGNLEIASGGGNINLTAATSISFANQGVILLDDPTKNITVSLTAPYVAMGIYYSPATQQAQQQTTFNGNGDPIVPHIYTDPITGDISGLAPLPGQGTLDINASNLVDVYTLSLQGFGTLNINQAGLPAGDVRGAGTLELQGDINIKAGQIYPATEANFTIAAYSGSINITGTGQLPSLPYSAGGTLDLYAATINQDGVLRAPMGVINLGAAPNTLDILAQSNFDQATTINLGGQSVTSVSLIDPLTGQALIIPYGTNQNGTNWIDPAGNDITLAPNGALGIPIKQIFVTGNSVTDAAGAVIDIQGGGDLYTARWVTGTGGTKDILNANNTGSFAVIPGYNADYAPLDPTSGYSTTTSLATTTLQVGDRVYLSGGGGLAAGYYTLLPAEYALLPGGFLVTKKSTAPVLAGSEPALAQTDGSALVTGYKFNGLAVGGGSAASAPSLYSTFEVASGAVVHSRAEYDNFTANTFLQQSAVAGNKSVPRLPVDAGQLAFDAGSQLLLNGSNTIETAAGTLTLSTPVGEAGLVEPVTIGATTMGADENLTSVGTGTLQTATTTGLGGLVDISSSSTIDILDSGTVSNALVLYTAQLDSLNAASLLIGGTRGTDGETVTVSTNDLEVNDHGDALTGLDLVFVSSGQLNIDAGSIISTPTSNGSITPPPLIISGNGALVRVSSGTNGKVARTNISSSNQDVSLNIAGATFSALGSTTGNPLSVGTLLLDSTGQFQLDSGASLASVLNGDSLTLNAGQISILFPNSGATTPTTGLVLTQAQIQALQQSVKNLNFTSYSSIDLYGAGSLGTNSTGQTVLQNLSFAASQIRGYYDPSSVANTGISLSALGSVSFQDASFNLTPMGANPISSQLVQSLAVNAPTIDLGGGTGNNSFAIYGFQTTNLTAGKDVLVMSTAAINQSTSTAAPQALFNVVDGALNLNTPLITSQTGSNLEILAGNEPTSGPNVYQNITISSNGTLDPTLEQGLDSTLHIKGANITDSSAIVMPSGQVTLEAAAGSLTMNGSVDVSGVATTFNNNITEYTSGGTVTLKADNGNLDLTGGALNVSAKSGVGTTAANAGSVALQASGNLIVDQTTVLHGQSGAVTSTATGPIVAQGQNGSFSLDAGGTNPTAEPGGTGTASDLSLLASILSPAQGNFTQSQNIRIRSGDIQVGASTVVTANSFTLSADTGNVDIYGTINAAGATGGQVTLDASGNVTLHDNSLVTVAGQRFADSGKGGSVSLQGGSYNGSTNASANVTIAPNATVDLSVGSGSVVQLAQAGNSVSLSTPGTVILQSGLSAVSSVTLSGSGYVLSPAGTRTTFITGTTLTNLASGSMVIFTTAHGSMTLAAGSAPVLLPAGVIFTTGSALQLTTSGTSSVAFQPGAAVTLPQGTPGNDQVILYGSGTVTEPGGTTIAFATIHDPGQPDDGTVTFTTTVPGQNPAVANYLSATSLPAGSQILFDSSAANTNARIAFANGGTGGSVPLALAATDTLIAPDTLGNATGTLAITVPASNFNPTGIVAQGNILSPSSIMLMGNQVYGANSPAASVAIDDYVDQVTQGATTNVPLWTSLISTILGTNSSSLAALTTAGYGAEIVNSGGDLVLNNTWDFSSLSEAGIIGTLTLRASGNIILQGGTFSTSSSTQGASLTDGFDPSANPSAPWEATLLTTPSWSFNLTAGADISAASTVEVTAGQGSLEVGAGGPSMTVDQASIATNQQGTTASTQNIFTAYYQTIRTGTGNINIATGQDVQLMNALATIYTAGQQLTPSQTTSVLSANDFDLPQLTIPGSTTATKSTLGNRPEGSPYVAQYSWGGGNIDIVATGDIEHVTQTGALDSSRELPTSWLDRRGFTFDGAFADNRLRSNGLPYTGPSSIKPGGIASTTWWVDFSNFLDGIAALGGGNITLIAGGSVNNVDASIATNARMVGKNSTGAGIDPNVGNLIELGGGDLVIQAGSNINGGVYYVERGAGSLDAGYKIMTNSTRSTVTAQGIGGVVPSTADPQSWLPTTLFVGAASFNVTAGNDLNLGSTLNPFLLPQNISNSYLLKTYFSTYAPSDIINAQSLTGNVTVNGATTFNTGSVSSWYDNDLGFQGFGFLSWSYFQPWLGLTETDPSQFTTATTLLPPTLQVVAFSDNSEGTLGNIDILGNLTLSPSPTGNLDLVAAGSISGLAFESTLRLPDYSTINLSDANPASVAGVASPISLPILANQTGTTWITPPASSEIDLFSVLNQLFTETGSTTSLLQAKVALHANILDSNGVAEPLHYSDSNPVQIDAGTGDISGLTLFASKFTDVSAGRDLTDIGLYIQNTRSDDVSVVAAGRDIIAYDANSTLRLGLESTYNLASDLLPTPDTGDIQISGPGAIEVLAGQNFSLGVASGMASTGLGLTSIGNDRNPVLPFTGADIIAAAGLGNPAGLDSPNLNFPAFITTYLTPGTASGNTYLADLGTLLGLTGASEFAVRTAFDLLTPSEQDTYALAIFYDVLRDSGRNGPFSAGYAAIETLFPGLTETTPYTDTWPYHGDITLTSREIKTANGGNISLLAPGGQVTVGLPINGSQTLEQGVFTVAGGDISIFADSNVNVGVSRIFTLDGGGITIWSSLGNIAAGASSKTVQSAPPTRVLIDPQSGNVQTDLGGLATGGGIGTKTAFVGAPPSPVDLIAPAGTVDAGDAGISASGDIHVAALHVANADNISAGGSTTGVPTTAAPNIAGLSAASSVAGSATQAGLNNTPTHNLADQTPAQLPSIITVEVLGYGGGDTD